MPVRPLISIVVVAFNMQRELPRTLRSLSPTMQRGIAADAYEIILIDNGSEQAIDPESCRQWGANITVHRMNRILKSPAAAVNVGLRQAQGELIGVMIDGARIASPGLLSNAVRAARLHDRPVISSLGFHLGPSVQMVSILDGYDRQVEDQLLADIDWMADGYRLFDASVFAGSSAGGWFQPINESNALFLRPHMWQELGGYDERFASPGGGFVNLDTYVRACELSKSQLIVLLGEGTFHQIHGGVATNAIESPSQKFHSEYVRIRGKAFAPPVAQAWYFGGVPSQAMTSIESSARMAR